MESIKIFVEEGKKKTFTGAVDWPGWCRWGKDEQSALQSLLKYGPRYAQVLVGSDLDFTPPEDAAQLEIVERHHGSATTDFGAPDAILEADNRPLSEFDYYKAKAVLEASWAAFDRAITKAEGHELRKGPRGGGRDLDKILAHVFQADQAYLRRVAHTYKTKQDQDLASQLTPLRQVILEALQAGMNGEIPEQGPRGGKIWPIRYYLRRAVWHTLDHLWEIEDRIE
jgi:hypothetical protein